MSLRIPYFRKGEKDRAKERLSSSERHKKTKKHQALPEGATLAARQMEKVFGKGAFSAWAYSPIAGMRRPKLIKKSRARVGAFCECICIWRAHSTRLDYSSFYGNQLISRDAHLAYCTALACIHRR